MGFGRLGILDIGDLFLIVFRGEVSVVRWL